MKYTFRRDGSPAKLRDLLLKESSLQYWFKDMRRGLLEDIADAKADGATRLRATLHVDARGAHGKVVILE